MNDHAYAVVYLQQFGRKGAILMLSRSPFPMPEVEKENGEVSRAGFKSQSRFQKYTLTGARPEARRIMW